MPHYLTRGITCSIVHQIQLISNVNVTLAYLANATGELLYTVQFIVTGYRIDNPGKVIPVSL